MQPERPSGKMPIQIDGVEYVTAADIHQALGVARQTLWRWRQNRKVPQGRRYRDKAIVFTHSEVKAIHEYANRLEPVDRPCRDRRQHRRARGLKASA